MALGGGGFVVNACGSVPVELVVTALGWVRDPGWGRDGGGLCEDSGVGFWLDRDVRGGLGVRGVWGLVFGSGRVVRYVSPEGSFYYGDGSD